MPRFNRIIGFVSVSFLLLFVARINKMELFTVYFKTIADVEVRNSQALYDHIDHGTLSELPSNLQESPRWNPVSAGYIAAIKVELFDQVAAAPVNHVLPDAPLLRRIVLPQTSPRAPDSLA